MTVLVFFLLIGFVFWIASLHDRPDFERRSRDAGPARLAELRQRSGSVGGHEGPAHLRIGALVLATTGFYTYVGQMVPQKEVQPPQEIVAARPT